MVSNGISPEYFFDKMSIDEVNAITSSNENQRREQWEQIRTQCFYSVAPYVGEKIKSPGDLIKFDWDKKPVKKASKKRSKYMTRKAQEWLNGKVQRDSDTKEMRVVS